MGCGDIDECDATGTGLNDCANIAAAGNYADSFSCVNTIGSYTCDRGAETLQPNPAPWTPDGTGGDGFTPWVDESGEEWGFTPGTNSAGEEVVMITGLTMPGLPADQPLEATIDGNQIIIADPDNPTTPVIGVVSADGKTITWTQDGTPIQTTSRTDVNECPPDAATDPCATQPGTTCYNTEPGFSCNCNIGTDGFAEWTFTDDAGAAITVQVQVNSATSPKATVTYTLSDGTTATGTLLGNQIEFTSADGSVMKTGTITKSADGTSENIEWGPTDNWTRVGSGTGGTPADPAPATPADPAPATPADPAPATPADPAPATPADPAPATPADPAPATPADPAPVPATPADPAPATPADPAPAPVVPAVPGAPAATPAPVVPGVPAPVATASPVTAQPVVPAPVAPGVPAPVVPAPVAPPTGTGGASVNGMVTGDPHFRINFNAGVDICFDVSGPDGTILNLIHEPDTGLVINGQIVDSVYKKHHSHRLAKIGVMSPSGGQVAFNSTAIETFTSTGTGIYGPSRTGSERSEYERL